MKSRYFCRIIKLLILLAIPASPALALQADQILLIVNKNSPESMRLATLYSELRQIPADRTVALDLPPDSEEIPFSTYETGVVAPVRDFLSEHHLQNQITCLLTFYGVPFRINAKTNSPEEKQELDQLGQQEAQILGDGKKAVETLEQQAIKVDPTFKPSSDNTLTGLNLRLHTALNILSARINAINDADQRAQALAMVERLLEPLGGPTALDLQTQSSAQWHQHVAEAVAQIRELQNRRWDPQARARVRDLAVQYLGKLGAAEAYWQQMTYFATEHTDAATDSELALLWWNFYPRQNWQNNPLRAGAPLSNPPALMVMRLDGPDPAIVERMMRTSIDVEKTGLQGIAALDARGIPPFDAKGNPDPFGQYDERIRRLGLILRTKTNLRIKLDDNEPVFAAHSVKDVALYVGWYRVGQYLPGCDFNPGAVGFHIASYEMIHLHGVQSSWVNGLLRDGVVASLGPVAEPYLTAFPYPEEFFPLLLTGKLTLAEVFWKTNPMTSWMISCIGDPLYTPYKVNPPMKVEDLSAPLRRAIPSPAP